MNCVKLNHIYRKACHNCFDPNVFVHPFPIALGITKVVEIDIHHPDNLSSHPGNWDVRHLLLPSFKRNNNNCGGGDKRFNFCLKDIKIYSDSYLEHDPMIIYIDLKDAFNGTTHSTSSLDNLIQNEIGLSKIYKPSDLLGNFQTLRDAANNQNWPTLGNLRGKIIFVLTGDNTILNYYLSTQGNNALAFVAPKVGGGSNATAYNGAQEPDGIWQVNRQYIVFYNLTDEQLRVSYNPNNGEDFMQKHGYISRVYEDFNTSSNEYSNDIYHKINNIAIKNVVDNFSGLLMNSQLIDINNITVGNTTSTTFIDSKYNHITQHASQTVTTQNLTVLSGAHYNIVAGQEVDLLPGTDIQTGANTDIFISNCEDYIDNMRVNPFANQEQGRALTKQEIDWMLKSSKANTGQTIIKQPLLQPAIFPNPTSGNFTITQLEEFVGGNLEITNLMGQVVFSQTINASILTIHLANQPKGIYLVKISSEKENVVQKVVLE